MLLTVWLLSSQCALLYQTVRVYLTWRKRHLVTRLSGHCIFLHQTVHQTVAGLEEKRHLALVPAWIEGNVSTMWIPHLQALRNISGAKLVRA